MVEGCIMSRNYSKPVISFQSLAVSTDIASSCEMTTRSAEYVCPVFVKEWGDMTILTNDCDMEPAEQICYHVPVEDNNVFSS